MEFEPDPKWVRVVSVLRAAGFDASIIHTGGGVLNIATRVDTDGPRTFECTDDADGTRWFGMVVARKADGEPLDLEAHNGPREGAHEVTIARWIMTRVRAERDEKREGF